MGICEITPVEETETVTKQRRIPTGEFGKATREKKVTVDTEKQTEEKRRENKKKDGLIGKLCQVFLRLLVVGTMATACLITIFNKQTVDLGGFVMRASYHVSPTFWFYMVGTGVVCAYSMISVPIVYWCYKNRFLHFVDMIMMALATASASAATSVGYIAKFGNETAGWAGVCDFCELFCMRSMISVCFSYVGLICLLIICTISSFNAKK